jgi:hypothetical protein
MVPVIIVYLHGRRQLLLREERIGGHFFGQNEGLCVPFFWDGPPTSPSFPESSSTERVRRSAPRAGLRAGDSHQPQMLDASILPQRLYGTCQWWRCWLLVCAQTLALPADKLRRLYQGLTVSLKLLLTDRPSHPLLVKSALQARPTVELRKPVHLWDVGGGRYARWLPRKPDEAKALHSPPIPPGRSNGQGLTSCHTPLWRVWQILADCLSTGQSLAQKVRGMGKVLQYPRRCRNHQIYHLQQSL